MKNHKSTILHALRDTDYKTFVTTIEQAVEEGGSVISAAEILGVSLRQMWRFMKDAKLRSPQAMRM